MNDIITSYLPSLNSVGIESSLVIFRNVFSYLSYSFSKPSFAELEKWIESLQDSNLNRLWLRQKEMKHPDFILYFAIWHFRNKTLREKKFFREASPTKSINDEMHSGIKEITSKINQEFDRFTTFDGVSFLGILIGAWMLNCPKASVLEATSLMPNPQPADNWLEWVFPGAQGIRPANDELELIYKLDYQVYYTFEDLEARNTE